MTLPKPDHQSPSAETAIVILEPAPGDRDAQTARLARWLERQARRLATLPASVVELPPVPARPNRRAS